MNKIGLDRVVVEGNDKSNYQRVYFETFKCQVCSHISDKIVKCPQCSSTYCKDCILWNNNKTLAIMSDKKPSCTVCLYDFSQFDYSWVNQNADWYKEYMLDRNVKLVIEEDFMIRCFFADEEGCTMKNGPYGKIIKHQVLCHACTDCKYLCWQDKYDCSCKKSRLGGFFNTKEMEKHMDELRKVKEQSDQVKQRIEEIKKRKLSVEERERKLKELEEEAK